jgi:hypothetical protein
MMAKFVLEGDLTQLAHVDFDSVPAVEEIIEIKGSDYVVRSRRWKSGRLGPSVTVTVRALLETAG